MIRNHRVDNKGQQLHDDSQISCATPRSQQKNWQDELCVELQRTEDLNHGNTIYPSHSKKNITNKYFLNVVLHTMPVGANGASSLVRGLKLQKKTKKNWLRLHVSDGLAGGIKEVDALRLFSACWRLTSFQSFGSSVSMSESFQTRPALRSLAPHLWPVTA